MKSASLGWMQTLADATRVRLLRLLEREELSVSELCSVVQLPQSTVSRHLKVLSADQWISNRRDGTNQLYSIAAAHWDAPRGELWKWVRAQADTPTTDLDHSRLQQVVAQRSRGEAFFESAAAQWDKLRTELFGSQLDAFVFAASLHPSAVVGELGCGSAPLSQLSAPYVQQVFAVDNSAAMLAAAQQRVGQCKNVSLVNAPLTATSLPADSLDMAWLAVVLPYLPEPTGVLVESARILRDGAGLVIVDLLPHERSEYQQELGHCRLGVSEEELAGWVAAAGLQLSHYTKLHPDPLAKGPALFTARVCRQ